MRSSLSPEPATAWMVQSVPSVLEPEAANSCLRFPAVRLFVVVIHRASRGCRSMFAQHSNAHCDLYVSFLTNLNVKTAEWRPGHFDSASIAVEPSPTFLLNLKILMVFQDKRS